MTRGLVLATLVTLAISCKAPAVASSGPTKVDLPVADTGSRTTGRADQGAPPSGTTKESPFPSVARFALANGLRVAVVSARTLPVVQVRLVVHAGSGDGPQSGVAALTAAMLKDGGTRALSSTDVVRRIETLGGDLGITTGFDATVLSLPLTKDQLGEGLSLLSQVVREPRFDEGDLRKRKARAIDDAADEARSDGGWSARHVVFRELFPEKSAYASFGVLPSQITRIDSGALRDFHRRFFVPKATLLVLAGDLDEAEGKTLAERHFGAWSGGERPKVERAAPVAPTKRRIFVADRPKSVQSDILVATLGPARKDSRWAAVRVANQVLGGGSASRLFVDVRERRGLAYTTGAAAFDLAVGEQPFVAFAGTETSKTAQTVEALLESFARMISAPPTAQETVAARSYVSDVFAIRMETIGSIADLVATQDEFDLPDGYWDAYRGQLRSTDASEVDAAAKALWSNMHEQSLVVVAGDADAVAPELAKLGDVTVVDPEKEFKTMRTIPQATR